MLARNSILNRRFVESRTCQYWKVSRLEQVFPVILGDVDANGNSNAQIIHQWSDRFRTRLLAQVEDYYLLFASILYRRRLILGTRIQNGWLSTSDGLSNTLHDD